LFVSLLLSACDTILLLTDVQLGISVVVPRGSCLTPSVAA